jgi:hypothetical protein
VRVGDGRTHIRQPLPGVIAGVGDRLSGRTVAVQLVAARALAGRADDILDLAAWTLVAPAGCGNGTHEQLSAA